MTLRNAWPRTLAACVVVLAVWLATTAQPAKAAAVGTETWWVPASGQFAPQTLWSFDKATPTGWRKDYQATTTGWPVDRLHTFSYAPLRVRPGLSLRYTVSGGTDLIVILAYSPATDVLRVNWAGADQLWFGCRSGRMPAYALAACR